MYLGIKEVTLGKNPRKALVCITDGGDNRSFLTATRLSISISIAADAPAGARSLTVTGPAGAASALNAFTVHPPRPTMVGTAPLPIPEVETGIIGSGYVVVTPDANASVLSATLTYGVVENAVVRSQAGILPTPVALEASLNVDVVASAARNLGVAIANPNPVSPAAIITLTLRDENGAPVASVSLNLPGLCRSPGL